VAAATVPRDLVAAGIAQIGLIGLAAATDPEGQTDREFQTVLVVLAMVGGITAEFITGQDGRIDPELATSAIVGLDPDALATAWAIGSIDTRIGISAGTTGATTFG
jgi:hypothetical protein